MKTLRNLLLVVTALITGSALAYADPTTDFDFWQGDWTVTLEAALPDGSWRKAEGKATARALAGGNGHMDSMDTGEYQSSGIRAFNVATGLWDYTMFDNLQMKGLKVWSGKFEDGVGTFEGALTLPTGAAIDTRIIIDGIEDDAFNWRFDIKLPGQDWKTNVKATFRKSK